jgi:hypothetical protein
LHLHPARREVHGKEKAMGVGRWSVALSLAVPIVVAACSTSEQPPPPAAVVVQSDERARPTIPGEASAQVIRETRLFADSAPLMSVQSRVGVAPVILDPGTYEIDALGTPLTLTLTEHWRLDYEGPGNISLTRPDAELEALLPVVSVHRPFGFADPTLAGFGGSGGWFMQDLSEWIDAVPQIVVLDSGDITVGDRLARWWDIDVDPSLGPTISGCEPGSCVRFMWSGSHNNLVARDLERIRWYEIPDPQGPIVVFVSTNDADFEEITSATDELLRTAVVGPSKPNPIRNDIAYAKWSSITSNTPTAVSGVYGVLLQAPFFLDIAQRPGEVVAWRMDGINSDERVGLVVPATALDGEPIESVDDVLNAIESNALRSTRSSGEILGMPATIIDFELEGEGMLLLSPPRPGFSSQQAIWPQLPKGRAWVIDSPIGPAIINATAQTQTNLDDAVERVAWFTDLTSFCDSTDSCGRER